MKEIILKIKPSHLLFHLLLIWGLVGCTPSNETNMSPNMQNGIELSADEVKRNAQENFENQLKNDFGVGFIHSFSEIGQMLESNEGITYDLNDNNALVITLNTESGNFYYLFSIGDDNNGIPVISNLRSSCALKENENGTITIECIIDGTKENIVIAFDEISNRVGLLYQPEVDGGNYLSIE